LPCSLKINITDELAVITAIDAYIKDSCAGLNPLTLDELGPTDSGDKDVRSPHLCGEIIRTTMADRHGRVPHQSELRDRFSDQLRPPDDDHILPFDLDRVPIKKLNAASRSAWHEAR